MRRIALAIGLVAAFVLAASTAFADSKVGDYQRLRVQKGTAGLDTAAWQNGSDSPNDSNTRRLHAVVGVDPEPNDTQYSYLVFYSRASLHLGVSIQDVKNLSFEFTEGTHVGAGAPRISVETANGDFLYLSATYCNHVLGASSGGAWGRADFTRFLTNCAFYDSNNVRYDADGVHTAIQVYAMAHPDVDLTQSYVVLDEEGTYNLDRISLGAGKMYTRDFGAAASCTTEASC